MSGIVLRIPTPPSGNHRLLVARGRAVLAPEHRAWARAAVAAIRAQLPRGWEPLSGPVALLLDVQVPGLSSDVSNRIKSIEDALTEARVWLDDRQVVLIHAAKIIGKRGNCDVVATIQPHEAPEVAARLATAEKRAARSAAPTWRDLADEQEAPEPYRRGVPTPNVRGGR